MKAEEGIVRLEGENARRRAEPVAGGVHLTELEGASRKRATLVTGLGHSGLTNILATVPLIGEFYF